MAEFRTIHSKMWRDSWFTELDVEGKLLWVYLITNTAASLTGIYYMTIKFAAFETGLNQERVQTLLAQFVLSGKIEYENNVVWIRRMRRYQAANESSPKIKPRIEKDLAEIPDCKVKRLYIAQYPTDIVSIPTHTETDTLTETVTETETPSGANAPVQVQSPPENPKGKERAERPHDLLFDAIAKVCCIDPKVKGNGAKIGKARAALADSEPSYSPDEVIAFGAWWNSDEWRRKKGPPTVWKLTEQIGIVRNGNGSKPSAPMTPEEQQAEFERLNPHYGKAKQNAVSA